MDDRLSFEFRKTDSQLLGREKHHHIAYLKTWTNPQTGMTEGEGFLSHEKDHWHKVVYSQEVLEQMDDYGNIIQNAKPAGWYVLPAIYFKEGGNSHVHTELLEYVPDYQIKPKENDKEKIEEVLSLWREATVIEEEAKKDAEESENFYRGKQWDSATKRYLESKDRAALVINDIEKNIDTFLGLYKENRTDIYYAPQEGTDQRACDIYNQVWQVIQSGCQWERQEGKGVKQQVIRGRGWYNVYVTLENDLQGEIRVENYNDANVYPGPHENEDLSDCEYLFREKDFSLGRLKTLYPEKAELLDDMFKTYETVRTGNLLTADVKSSDHVTYATDQYTMSDNYYPAPISGPVIPNYVNGHLMIDVARKNFKVLECQRVYWLPSSVIVSNDGEINFNASGWYPEDLRKVEKLFDNRGSQLFQLIKRNVKRLRIIKCVGNVVLSDEFPADLPSNEFYMIPVYCKKQGDYYWGKVQPAKDPQREVNKRHSQAIDIGNKMCAYAYIYDDMTFDDPKLENIFKENITTPGAIIKVSNINNKPVREEGVKFPTEIVQLLELNSRKITELMNITVEPGGANEGVMHLMQRIKDKLIGNEHIFTEIKLAKEKIGKLVIGLIQRYYDGERILRILRGKPDPLTQEQIMIGEQPVEDYTADEIDEILSVADADKIDIKVIEVNPSPTSQMMEFALLQELRAKGIEVPAEMLIETANIPQTRKRKLLEMVSTSGQQQAQSQQQLADVEIEKTLASKGIITPGVQARLGIDAQGNAVPQEEEQAQIPEGQEPIIPQTGIQGLPEQGGQDTFSRPAPRKRKLYKQFDETLGKEVVVLEEM